MWKHLEQCSRAGRQELLMALHHFQQQKNVPLVSDPNTDLCQIPNTNPLADPNHCL